MQATSSANRYAWDPTQGQFIPRHVSAQVMGEAVTRIVTFEGGCPPGRLLEEARPASSELHDAFEWDDKIAGEAHRLDQARTYLRVLRPEALPESNPYSADRFVSVFYEDPAGNRVRGYRPITLIRKDVEQSQQMLADALAQLEGLRRRYESLAQLKGVWTAVQKAKAKLAAKTTGTQ